ncbi:DUF1682-domain-containing protein [Irpex rosettiformis]|uniref:DUF1682-domain-containing protein n=1 Tax=Irpex rosettiformis TaxID=378272 RepID=A0ACB8TQ38_9APHY|nr:DUF1682-domain-containing protein [Irpex rosettiformis]
MSTDFSITKVLSVLTPPPVVLSPEYDGLEFRWKMFTFRPALFQQELFYVLAIALYVAWYYVGRSSNFERATSWFDAHFSLYEDQFSKPVQKGGLTKDGHSDFFVFSTGRRALSSLHTVFKLRPRHDLLQYAYQIIRGAVELHLNYVDELELDLTFQDGVSIPDTVWAIVAKSEIKGIRETRWDLSFTRTTEAAGLPSYVTVMSEFADVTENLLKPHGPLSLAKVLSDPAIQPYFRSLSLTDQPRTRPSAPIPGSQRKKHLILSLVAPPTSDSAATVPLVQAFLQLADVIAGVGGWGIGKGPGHQGMGLNACLRPETKTKLKAVREKVEKEIKDDAGKEQREEAEAEKAAAKKKAETERLSKLSAAEQKKTLEREKKKALRKTQGKLKAR